MLILTLFLTIPNANWCKGWEDKSPRLVPAICLAQKSPDFAPQNWPAKLGKCKCGKKACKRAKYIIRKLIQASNIREALRKERKEPVHEVYVDEKQDERPVASAVGFRYVDAYDADEYWGKSRSKTTNLRRTNARFTS